MTKYSRVSKYEDLRNKLQNDTDTKIESKDLSRYEKKLNEINSSNFEAPKETYSEESYDPIHARRRQYLDNTNEINTPVQPEVIKKDEQEKTSTNNLDYNNANFSSFNNDYLNDYIREVKEYNKEQGNAFSTNTNLNVLHSIKKDEPQQVPSKPYVDEKPYDLNPFYANRNENTTSIPKMDKTSITSIPKEHTTSIPVMNNPVFDLSNDDDYETSDVPQFKSSARTFEEFMDDDNLDTSTISMTKEDIAAEVQSLIRGQEVSNSSNKKNAKKDHSDTFDYHFEAERNARQQLLNETTQMRAQLDNYEDNLSEVSSKMQHTDKMISNVLIVLIIVLIVVLLVVIYWILGANGIL